MAGGPEVDQENTERFGELLERARRGELDHRTITDRRRKCRPQGERVGIGRSAGLPSLWVSSRSMRSVFSHSPDGSC